MKVANEYIIPDLLCFCKKDHFVSKRNVAPKLNSVLQILLQLELQSTWLIDNDIYSMKGSYDAEGVLRFLMKATEKESYASPQPHQDVFLSVLLFLMKTYISFLHCILISRSLKYCVFLVDWKVQETSIQLGSMYS